MDKYVFILSKTYGCYKIKKLLPKRFHNVDLKTNEEYKKLKKAEDKKFDDKIVKFQNDSWWNSLDNNTKKEYIKKYETKEIAYQRRLRFIQSFGLCKTYKIIDETFFK
jgi:predicted HTH transcriptional regulator